MSYVAIRGGSGNVLKPVKTRPQDNLYLAVNADYLKNAEIPADKPATGSFNEIAENVEKQLMQDLADFASGEKSLPDNPELKKAVDLYQVALAYDEQQITPDSAVIKDLHRLLDLRDFADFNQQIAQLSLDGYALPLDFGVDVDMKDTKHHVLSTSSPSTILPDTTQYGTPEGDQLLAIYRKQSIALLELALIAEPEATALVDAALAFDQKISKIVKSNEEWADYPASYNPYDFADFAAKFKSLDVTDFVQAVFGEVPAKVIEADPKFLDHAEELLNADNFAEIQAWMSVKFINSVTGMLNQEFRETGFAYRQALSGVKELAKPEKHAYQVANSLFDEVIGIYYGQSYLGSDAKADVIAMIKKMIAIYRKRLEQNEWLSAATITKAITKLNTLELKVGYPDKVEEIYQLMTVTPVSAGGNLYDNLQATSLVAIKYNIAKLNKPVDRTTWNMPGNLVNASYDPSRNDLTFPAAILQAPFYDLDASSSTNYGGIGAVIAHEISHAFDNNGAKFDEFGNMKDWWTPEDFKRFEEKTQAEIALFDGIPYADGKINGKLVVSENVADVGGLSNALEAAKTENDANLRELFENWARVWAMKAQTEYSNMLLKVDVHAPGPMRANVQPQNFQEFYDIFDVQPEDGMYLEPDKRVQIW